jgi:hypothetical protein
MIPHSREHIYGISEGGNVNQTRKNSSQKQHNKNQMLKGDVLSCSTKSKCHCNIRLIEGLFYPRCLRNGDLISYRCESDR